jgi:hypothetical protein
MDQFRDRLRAAMPLDTIITDLWDWDVHFEDGDHLSDDWLIEAAFGSDDSLDDCADQLEELFHCKVREYDIDYDQYADPDAFDELVTNAARNFIVQWRHQLAHEGRFRQDQRVTVHRDDPEEDSA